MASDQEFVDFIVDQFDADCAVSARRMFGEYGLYSGAKFIGSVCDNRLFIKPTAAGRAFIGEPVEAPPYPGARNSFLVEDRVEDGEWLSELVRVTAADLPEPKPKKPKSKPRKST